MVMANSDLLAGQWSEAERLRAHVDTFVQMMDEGPLAALDQVNEFLSLDGAEGVWLDRIGEILGLPRPSSSDPSMDPRWGFDDAGQAFGSAPYRGTAANALAFPLPDASYRRFLKARAITVLARGTYDEFERAVKFIDPSAVIVDSYNFQVTVTVTPSLLELVRLADSSGALPRVAGVMVTYA